MKQTEFKFKSWGGKRKGAGRKNLSKKLNHMPREKVDFKRPLHITHKLVKGCPSLRNDEFLDLFRDCARKAKKFGLHIVHYSLQGNHIHMIVEAKDNDALSLGMRSLMSTFAKKFNAMTSRKGPVFSDRYHLKVITNPTQMKRALEYVLLNYCKHSDMLEHMDPYSSGYYFKDWRKLVGKKFNDVLEWELEGISPNLAKAGLSKPRSWLAAQGWMRARA